MMWLTKFLVYFTIFFIVTFPFLISIHFITKRSIKKAEERAERIKKEMERELFLTFKREDRE